MTEPEQFWARVEPGLSACWFWRGAVSRDGYGKATWHGRTWRAHRLAYALTHGPIPAHLQVCHACDTPLCCRPDHLWVGTHDENHADCTRKGRRPTGARHGSVTHPASRPRGAMHYNAKLSPGQVAEIRQQYRPGLSAQVAHDFGISRSQVCRIVRGARWKET